MLVSDAGINVLGARARIADNFLFDVLFGIYLRGCTEALVENNRIRGRVEVEMGLKTAETAGVKAAVKDLGPAGDEGGGGKKQEIEQKDS